MSELVKYDAMCRAIDAAYEVDEVKDIRDKAIAWEVYSRQARNTENERRACEIRLRAERKAGQLLKQMTERGERQGDGRPGKQSHGATVSTLDDLGVSKTQSSRWQGLADVPEDQFEAALAGPEKPTTSGILTASDDKPKRDERALWLWGLLKDFERGAAPGLKGVLGLDPNELLDQMSEHMKTTTRRLAPMVARWLERIAP